MIRNNVEYPVEVIMTKFHDDIIPEYQRLYVWGADRQSKMIRHILNGYPTHKIFIDFRDMEKWSLLDGQQRITTIKRFINNEFRLNNETGSTEMWNGKYFRDLTGVEQRAILNYSISCEMIHQASDKEIEGLFDGLNSGMPLGKITEILLTNLQIKHTIDEVKAYPFIKETIDGMSETVKSKQEDDLLVLRIIALFTNGIMGLEGDSLEEFLRHINNKEVIAVLPKIKETCESIVETFSHEHFGMRKSIPCHTIPNYIYYKTEFEGDYSVFLSKLLEPSNLAYLKALNNSDTSSRRKQIQRMSLFRAIGEEL